LMTQNARLSLNDLPFVMETICPDTQADHGFAVFLPLSLQ
jgi:hypothetical protein